jgi:hypothetical protein
MMYEHLPSWLPQANEHSRRSSRILAIKAWAVLARLGGPESEWRGCGALSADNSTRYE